MDAEAYACPDCDTYLVQTQTKVGWAWYCPACRGRLVGTAVLRRSTAKAAFVEVWQEAQSGQGTPGRTCPAGPHAMLTVSSTVGHGPMQVDVCPRCNVVWFDANEFEALPEPPPQPVARELPPQAAEALALAEVQAMAERRRKELSAEGPDEVWKVAPALLGMPVEVDAPESRGFAWLMAGLTLVVCATSICAWLGDPQDAYLRYGAVSAEPGRLFAYTWLTCFFLHGSVMHLVGNMYFMLLFGHHLESDLGRARLALLLLVGTFVASMLHAVFNWGSPAPAIGASGGISALITCYAVACPYARFALLVGYGLMYRWINLPGWGMVGVWVLLQFLTAARQMQGQTNVAGWAHLGGAAVGLAAGFWWRERLSATE